MGAQSPLAPQLRRRVAAVVGGRCSVLGPSARPPPVQGSPGPPRGRGVLLVGGAGGADAWRRRAARGRGPLGLAWRPFQSLRHAWRRRPERHLPVPRALELLNDGFHEKKKKKKKKKSSVCTPLLKKKKKKKK